VPVSNDPVINTINLAKAEAFDEMIDKLKSLESMTTNLGESRKDNASE